jgi:hypothetical protein
MHARRDSVPRYVSVRERLWTGDAAASVIREAKTTTPERTKVRSGVVAALPVDVVGDRSKERETLD